MKSNTTALTGAISRPLLGFKIVLASLGNALRIIRLVHEPHSFKAVLQRALDTLQTNLGTGWDYATYALVQTGDGGYALAGMTSSSGAGSTDFWLAKKRGDGMVQDWSPDLILIALVVAVIVVVILLAAVLMRRKSRGSPKGSY